MPDDRPRLEELGTNNRRCPCGYREVGADGLRAFGFVSSPNLRRDGARVHDDVVKGVQRQPVSGQGAQVLRDAVAVGLPWLGHRVADRE